jgi:hypothetical protein
MVSLLNPKQNKTSTAYDEPESGQIAPVNHSQNSPAEPVVEFAASSQRLTGDEPPIQPARKISGLASPGLWQASGNCWPGLL